MSDNTLFGNSLLTNFQANILIFARIIGIFAFNPIFSRNNIPTRVKIGASFVLTLLVSGTVISATDLSVINYTTFGSYAIAILLETAVGFILGFLTQIFVSMLLFAGEMMDTASGLGMAKIYDPSTQTQQALFGTYINYMFIILFFISNAHLQYVKIFVLSYQFIPLGFEAIDVNVFYIILEYFGTLFTLALKLSLPIVVAEVIVEICIGILMKTVPSIQVMTVNIQVKVIVGLLLAMILAYPMGDAIQRYMDDMMTSIEGILPLITAGG